MAKEENAGPEGLSEDQLVLLQEEGVDVDAAVQEAADPNQPTLKPPETEQEAAPEAKEESGDEKAPETESAADKAPAGYVPSQALKEAREQTKQYREELRQMQEWQRQIADKLSERREAKQEAPEIPDAETQPVESIAWSQQQIQAMQRAQMEREQQYQQEAQRQHQAQQTYAFADAHFQQATQADPEVQVAYDHAAKSYKSELEALGFPPEQMQARINHFLAGFAQNYVNLARPNGVSMGDYVKQIATARGWRPEAPKEENKAEETIERQQKAMEASKTLSKSGQSSGESPLKDLAAMSGEEVEEFALENPELLAKLQR